MNVYVRSIRMGFKMATQRKTSSGKRKMTKKEKAKRRQKKIMILLGEIIAVIVLALLLYFVVISDKIEKTNFSKDEIKMNEGIDNGVELEDVSMNNLQSDHMKGYRNIALFGVDSRKGALGKGTLSDTILVASINEQTKEVKLISIYRDTYLNLGNDTYNKANSAYSKGGPAQAINMLNMNLDLNITDYVTVGFRGVVDTVDALGGVTIDVDSEEQFHLNNYQIGTSEALGRSYTPLNSTGMVKLDGMQATSYCRIRYTAGDDFKRAERQREVIKAIVEEAQKASPAKLNQIANDTFPQIATSLELSEVLSLMDGVKEYQLAGSSGFPFDELRATGTVGSKGSCVMPVDLTANVSQLHLFLFGQEGYDPSQTVKDCSAKIRQDTGK